MVAVSLKKLFFKQKTAYEINFCLVGSEMCIRDSLGPLLPYVSEPGFEALLNRLAESVNRVLVDRLNIKTGNWKNIEVTLEKYYPKMLGEFKAASQEPSAYYDSLRGKVKRMLDERAIPHDILF